MRNSVAQGHPTIGAPKRLGLPRLGANITARIRRRDFSVYFRLHRCRFFSREFGFGSKFLAGRPQTRVHSNNGHAPPIAGGPHEGLPREVTSRHRVIYVL